MVERLPELVRDDELVIRLWKPDDVEMLHRAVLRNVEHLRPWMPWVALEPLTIEQRATLLEEWQDNWESGEGSPMAMLVGEEVVGGTGLTRRGDQPSLEIGYWVDVDHQGHGHATRAARLLTTAAFALGRVTTVEIHHDRANVRSGRVPARLGYQFMGEHPDEKVAPGEVGIDCTWRMTRQEWHQAELPGEGGPKVA